MINKKTGSKTDKKRIVSFDLDMTLLDKARCSDPYEWNPCGCRG